MRKNVLILTVFAAVLCILLALPVTAAEDKVPVIVENPQNYGWFEGNSATYYCKADGENVTYKWYITFNGVTYDMQNIKEGDPWTNYAGEEFKAGTSDGRAFCYFGGIGEGLGGSRIYCEASNEYGTVQSCEAIIDVFYGNTMLPPEIKVKAEVTVEQSNSDLLKLYCAVTDCPIYEDVTYEYKWFEVPYGQFPNIEETEYPDTDPVLVIDRYEMHTKYYACRVTSHCGTTENMSWSSVIKVNVVLPGKVVPEEGENLPVFTENPQNYGWIEGSCANYYAKAKGNDVKYNWYVEFDGQIYDACAPKEGDAWLNYVGEGYDAGMDETGRARISIFGIQKELNGARLFCTATDENGTSMSSVSIIMDDERTSESMLPPDITVPAELYAPKGDAYFDIKVNAKAYELLYTRVEYTYTWYTTPDGRLENIYLCHDSKDRDTYSCDVTEYGTKYYICMIETRSGELFNRSYTSPIAVHAVEELPEPEPTPTPTPAPTPTPTPEPTPTQAPTPTPEQTSTPEPTPGTTEEATHEPSGTPSAPKEATKAPDATKSPEDSDSGKEGCRAVNGTFAVIMAASLMSFIAFTRKKKEN